MYQIVRAMLYWSLHYKLNEAMFVLLIFFSCESSVSSSLTNTERGAADAEVKTFFALKDQELNMVEKFFFLSVALQCNSTLRSIKWTRTKLRCMLFLLHPQIKSSIKINHSNLGYILNKLLLPVTQLVIGYDGASKTPHMSSLQH